MKILHVIANLAPRYGGPAKACVAMAQAVARLGHAVSIYTTNQDGPGELAVPLDRPVSKDGVAIHYFPIQPPRFWGTSWPLARALSQKIKEFDLLHIHSLYLFHDLVAGHYCRQYGIPYLIRPHGTLDPYIHRRHRWRKTVMEAWFENRNLRQAAALHFTSEEEMRLAAPYTGTTPGAVVPLGVELREFQDLPEPGRFRARFPKIGQKRIILFLGRINFKKGLDLLVQAMARVVRHRQDVHLVVAGPDNDGWGGRVKEWLDGEGILGCATFTGMLLGEEKLAALRDAEMFVLPSYSENFGLAVIEALACGLPVVISDKVNIWREVAAGGAGLVAPCDAAALAAALERLLEAPELAAAMGQRGRKLVAERFQWGSIALTLEDWYARIIAEGRARKAKPGHAGKAA
jgi:glycosyltransferase involved in cell wall biosynthesis